MAATKDAKEGSAKGEKDDKLKTDGVITAVYKVNLHCQQCARDIKKPLMRTQGVHGVEVAFDKGEIKVKGVIDVIEIHQKIEKLSKKKVELVSPQVKITPKKKAAATPNKVKETKEPILRTTTMKVHLHCDKCEKDLRNKLLKHKGIYSVKTDMKAQTLTVQGIIESDKLLSYITKNVHKHAEIISSKTDQEKQEKKDIVQREAKKEEKKDTVKPEAKKDDLKVEAKKEEKKDTKKPEAKKDDLKAGAESSERFEIVEFKEQVKIEAKSNDGNVPYFVHYVYAPQLFSDENPNACSII